MSNEMNVNTSPAEASAEMTEEEKQQLLEKFDKEAKTRTFVSKHMDLGFKIFCILVTVYHLVFAAGIFTPETLRHRAIHVAMMLVLSFAMYPATKKASRKTIAWYDWVLMALSVVTAAYMYINYNDIVNRAGLVNRGDKVFSNFYTNTEGIFGSSVNVASTYIFLFICFGEFMNKCGMGKFFNDIAMALAGWSKGGPAKVAIIAAGLLGMINGAAVAVVVTTGAFTIPLMRKSGYDREFSGAIVATGSVGGQLMPPVMGAAAFIMAETLGIKYSTLLISAIIPAIIYYMGILFQIQMRADKLHMEPTPRADLPKVGDVMKEYGHLAIPIVFLVYMLFFSGKTVIMAAFYSIICTIVVAQLKKNTRMSLEDIVNALIGSAKSTVSVAIACACVGCIVGVCSVTGFALNLAATIVKIGGQSLLFTLVFSMVTCMILGMGLPSIPSYIITSTVAAPALVTLGIPPIAAHMFCFYFAMFANLTPPVALASFAAAGISGGDPMKTGYASVKLALAGFILPYMFIYNTELLLLDTTIPVGVRVAVTAIIGVFLISIAVEGFLYTKVNILFRILGFVGAYLLIDSGFMTDIIGIVIAVGIILMQKMLAKKETPAAA